MLSCKVSDECFVNRECVGSLLREPFCYSRGDNFRVNHAILRLLPTAYIYVSRHRCRRSFWREGRAVGWWRGGEGRLRELIAANGLWGGRSHYRESSWGECRTRLCCCRQTNFRCYDDEHVSL